jgi:hypothetical protein
MRLHWVAVSGRNKRLAKALLFFPALPDTRPTLLGWVYVFMGSEKLPSDAPVMPAPLTDPARAAARRFHLRQFSLALSGSVARYLRARARSFSLAFSRFAARRSRISWR